MCFLALLVCAACAGRSVPAAPITAPSALEQLRRNVTQLVNSPGVSRGTWGILVRSLDSPEPLVDVNSRALLVPASVAKLVALAVATDVVGWDFTFETTLRATGPIEGGVLEGDLIIVGSGDPSIGGRAGEDLRAWIDAVKQAGILRISGRVIGDDDAIDDARPGAMWAWDDLGYTSGVLFGALNYGENRVFVTIGPGATPGDPTTLSVPAYASDRPIINRSTTGATGTTTLVWPEQRPGEEPLTIAGSVPAGVAPVGLFISAGNPTRWFASVLRRELEHAGVDVTGGAFDIDDVSPRPDSAAARLLFTHRSKPLAEIAVPMMKNSINLYSEAILRLSAGTKPGRSNDDALAVVRQAAARWGLLPDAMQVVDGSGLSRRDALAPDGLVTLLTQRYDPTSPSPWLRALPIAGRDGSLENRMRGTAAEGNVRAKTGTMSNVRTLAGYVRTRDEEPLAFAIMVNNFEGTGRQASDIIDAIVVRLAEFSRR